MPLPRTLRKALKSVPLTIGGDIIGTDIIGTDIIGTDIIGIDIIGIDIGAGRYWRDRSRVNRKQGTGYMVQADACRAFGSSVG